MSVLAEIPNVEKSAIESLNRALSDAKMGEKKQRYVVSQLPDYISMYIRPSKKFVIYFRSYRNYSFHTVHSLYILIHGYIFTSVRFRA